MPTESGTPTVLDWYVQAVGDDTAFAVQCTAEADALVANFIGAGNPFAVPTVIVERATLEVGADLYYRRTARNGIVSFGGEDMPAPEPMRISRDPMAAAYPILRPFLPALGL